MVVKGHCIKNAYCMHYQWTLLHVVCEYCLKNSNYKYCWIELIFFSIKQENSWGKGLAIHTKWSNFKINFHTVCSKISKISQLNLQLHEKKIPRLEWIRKICIKQVSLNKIVIYPCKHEHSACSTHLIPLGPKKCLVSVRVAQTSATAC